MIRLLTGILLSAMAGITAISQSQGAPKAQQGAGSSPQADLWQNKAQVLRLIDLNEAEAREGEATHADHERLAMNYSELGALYMDAGMSLKAEDAFRRAIALLKGGPQDRLIDEMEHLAVLQLSMGETRQAERNAMKALQLRQTLKDPVGIALAESAIAGIYDVESKFTKARDHAKKAYDVLADRSDVNVPDRVGVWHALGFALTGLQDCDRGIKVLKDALEMAKRDPGVGDASIGFSEYVLGIGYWHCRDRESAAAWLQHGTTDMRAEFGWSHAGYVNAMRQYALFLRQSGQLEQAVSAEAVVHQAESVVDVSSLAGRTVGLHTPSH